MFTACSCIGDCLIFKHIMKRKLLCMDFYCFQNPYHFLKDVQAILRKFGVKAQKHDKMDGAEKLLSISQCQTTVVYHRDSVNGHIFFNYFTCFSYLLSVFIKSLSLAPRFSCLQSMCNILSTSIQYFSIWMWIVYCTLTVNMKIQVLTCKIIKKNMSINRVPGSFPEQT